MHLIYSKLTSSNVLNGVVGKKKFSIDFKPGETTKVKDEEYESLVGQPGSVFAFLEKSGDFIEKAEMVTNDIAFLEGNLVKAQSALDAAKKALKENDAVDGVKIAGDVLMLAEDILDKASNSAEKKTALADVKEAKTALVLAKKEAKKGK